MVQQDESWYISAIVHVESRTFEGGTMKLRGDYMAPTLPRGFQKRKHGVGQETAVSFCILHPHC